MDSLDKRTDEALALRVADLHAHDDESGDGRISAADMKLQLDRIEAQLELQDRQNRAILRGQRVRLVLTLLLALLLCGAVVYLWHQVDLAYADILETTASVNALAARVQQGLEVLDNEELEALMESLPGIADKLSSVDVDALNEALGRIPALADAVTDLQQRVQSIQNWFNNLSGLFGR